MGAGLAGETRRSLPPGKCRGRPHTRNADRPRRSQRLYSLRRVAARSSLSAMHFVCGSRPAADCTGVCDRCRPVLAMWVL